jgi:hypothetical protein
LIRTARATTHGPAPRRSAKARKLDRSIGLGEPNGSVFHKPGRFLRACISERLYANFKKGGSHLVSNRKLKPVEFVWPDDKESQSVRIQREIQLLEETIEILKKRVKFLKARLARFH